MPACSLIWLVQRLPCHASRVQRATCPPPCACYRSRSPRRGGSEGRGTGDVFRERPAAVADDIKAKYGDASGTKLFDDKASGRKDYLKTEEVYSLGGSRR